jgi:hypothetical protein
MELLALGVGGFVGCLETKVSVLPLDPERKVLNP